MMDVKLEGMIKSIFLTRDSKWNHSRNFVDPILNYLILNNGYHTMHHMYPGKHWTELKELHEKMVKPHIDPRLDCPSLFGYLFKTFIYPGKRKMNFFIVNANENV